MEELVERYGWMCPKCEVCWSPEITHCLDCCDETDDREGEEFCKDCGVGSYDEGLMHSFSTGWHWICGPCETKGIEK